jgi:signal transduction histidine kinase
MAQQCSPTLDDVQCKLEDALQTAYDEREQEVIDCAAELAEARRELQDEVLRRKQVEESLALRAAQLKATALELTQVEQHERQRLAGVLHDHVQQLLVAAKFRISHLAKRMKQQELDEVVRKTTALLSEAITLTRTLAVELSPPISLNGGLVPALEWLGQWMQEKHGLTIRVTADDEGLEVGDEKTRLMLFNAVRELLFNVTKHAKVKAADVQIRRVGNQIQIVVADSGVGFNSRPLGKPGDLVTNLGLFSIRKRLDLLGGRFEIDSSLGRGSRFTLRAPVSPGVS